MPYEIILEDLKEINDNNYYDFIKCASRYIKSETAKIKWNYIKNHYANNGAIFKINKNSLNTEKENAKQKKYFRP